jgi:predicted metal-dependent phosphoesterase TrpH
MKSSMTQLVLAPDTAVDLHLHTIHSDGTWTPEQLLDHLAIEQFGLAAIADHDRVDTLASLQHLAKEKHLPVLAAVEMSTSWAGELTDVLCYGFDPEENELGTLAQDVLRRQQENTTQVFGRLLQQGFIFSGRPGQAPQHVDELAAILEKNNVAQPHELVALLKRYGYGTGETSAGKIVMDAGVSFATNDLAVIVEAAHKSGAVCLIAHPGRGDGFTHFDVDLLDQLRVQVPIDGIEVYYPVHTPEQISMYREYAQKHGLLISSGSDSHGPNKKPRTIAKSGKSG